MPPGKTFAGVVPYALRPADGRVVLLLSREAMGKCRGSWAGFAGGVDLVADSNDPLSTAAREGFEESAGLLGKPDVLRDVLRKHARRVDTAAGTHFLLPMQYNAYLPAMFDGVRAALLSVAAAACPDTGVTAYSPCLEKDALCWEPLDGLQHTRLRLRYGFFRDVPLLQAALADAATGRGPG